MSSRTRDILNDAADLIEPPGKWTRGSWGSTDSCMCAEGAICAAGGLDPRDLGFMFHTGDTGRAIAFFKKHMPPTPPHAFFKTPNPIAYWNDRPDRTQEEVVAKLREVAALAPEDEPCS